jgi:polysaccharide deacetylase family sporulation protein PdaB
VAEVIHGVVYQMTIVVISRRLALILGLAFFVLWPWVFHIGWQAGAGVLAVVNPADRKLPIYSVATDQQRVAFSFDAAWGAERTPVLLDLLDKHGVKTTFFLVSFWVEDYPELAREISDRGHEIGLHSTTHPHLNSLDPDDIRRELAENYRLINKVTGQKPWLFRPPFGEYSNKVLEAAEKEGLTTIQWSLDSLDWKELSAEAIIERILAGVKPGDIILFHNNGKNTPAAVDVILSRLRNEGYTIVPVSELIYKSDYYIDHEGKQHPK